MQEIIITRQEIAGMEKVPRLKILSALPGFKSVNIIGTTDKKGRENVAIFSSVIHVGSDPPLLGCLMRHETVRRHTYQNISSTGWYTINHVHEDMYEQAHQTSGKYREDLSEFEICNLTPFYSDKCPAPYVQEARIRIGLKLVEEHRIEANKTILAVGSVEEVALPESTLHGDHSVDIEQSGTVALSGLGSYHRTEEIDRLPIVRVEKDLKRKD